ncbi:hypothetical protein RJ55_08332 [Drechmeria coniospora]|nr:hypothetical protein RJ55_08332 [Drechmeria coniospora]
MAAWLRGCVAPAGALLPPTTGYGLPTLTLPRSVLDLIKRMLARGVAVGESGHRREKAPTYCTSRWPK